MMFEALRDILKTKLPRSSKEVLWVSTSKFSGCEYSVNWLMAPTSWAVTERRNCPEPSESLSALDLCGRLFHGEGG